MDRAQKPEKYYSTNNDAVNYILQTADQHPGEISIVSSGPVTNIAQAIQLRPDIMAKIKRIIIMGGCTQPMDAYDVSAEERANGKSKRSGNITRASEFNFYMAPQDAQIVMSSGLAITLLPMNCTH